MGYKSITVIVTDSSSDATALAAAVALALRDNAHLDVHCIGVDPARYDALPLGGSAMIIDMGATQAREQAESLLAWVRKRLPVELEKVATQAVVAPQLGLDAIVARLARYADLVVAGKPYGPGQSPMQVSVLEAALFGTGAAIMVVPESDPLPELSFKCAVVAWNESDESFAAIRAAMPVLLAASRVDIAMIDPPSHSAERSDPGGAVCMMLARYGIRAEVSILARTLPRVSEVLMRFARERGADVIVMGAYGHSRFREAILGGATREMLETTTLPLVMAH